MTEVLELRRGTTADAAAIRALTREAYAKWVALIGREPVPMAADYDEAVRKHRFDLLYVDGKMAALIETIGHADHLLVVNVAVSPAFQKRGFGRRLLAHAEEIATASSLNEVRLYTNRLYVENIKLYASLGYRVDYEEEFMAGIAVHMSKRLQPSATL